MERKRKEKILHVDRRWLRRCGDQGQQERRELSRSGPRISQVEGIYDAASVSTTVTSHSRFLRACQGMRVMPSGRFLYVLERSEGSLLEGIRSPDQVVNMMMTRHAARAEFERKAVRTASVDLCSAGAGRYSDPGGVQQPHGWLRRLDGVRNLRLEAPKANHRHVGQQPQAVLHDDGCLGRCLELQICPG